RGWHEPREAARLPAGAPMSLAWSLYRAVAPALGALAPAARVVASAQERRLWGERLGHVGWPGGCHAWIHAASLGESLGVAPLLGELLALQPGARVWLTATTRGGRARLAEASDRVSLAPLDAPQCVRRFFSGIHPERLFLMETELWPHWLMRARADGVPVVVVSARLSERSARHYARLGGGFRKLVAGLAAVLCQSHADAERWTSIGAPRLRTAVVGNLKNDALPSAAAVPGAARAGLGLDRERPLLVLGSLRPGEARMLARAWLAVPKPVREYWQVVAVPRHPRASAELAREAREAGVVVAGPDAPAGAWRWDDRLGVLAGYYAVSDAAFVGGSLLPYGGHNPLEPAACGAALLMGPFFESQHSAVTALAARDAIRIASDPPALNSALVDLLADEAGRHARGAAALAVTGELRGAARRTLDLLTAWRLWPAG
ncbi:MAG: glycosyltransferase N-terminal domain-containing protein, partial [Candidatus Eisenbacteria bacterium]